MKKVRVFKVSLLVLPFLMMVIINEFVRFHEEVTPYTNFGITMINPLAPDQENCTWICHNQTQYCKDHHVKHLAPYFETTDLIYFGVIDHLHQMGNYAVANLLILVLGFPLAIWLFLIKGVSYQLKINQIKASHE